MNDTTRRAFLKGAGAVTAGAAVSLPAIASVGPDHSDAKLFDALREYWRLADARETIGARNKAIFEASMTPEYRRLEAEREAYRQRREHPPAEFRERYRLAEADRARRLDAADFDKLEEAFDEAVIGGWHAVAAAVSIPATTIQGLQAKIAAMADDHQHDGERVELESLQWEAICADVDRIAGRAGS